MSLLRQRAIEVNVESTLSVLRPALARLRLVSAISSASDPESNAFGSKARLAAGAASAATDVKANSAATARGNRRGRWAAVGFAPSDIRIRVLCAQPAGV